MSASNTKRKPDEESRSSFPGSYPKKPRIESSDSQTQSVLDLQNLLDISALQSQAELRTRFDELGAALLKDFCLVVHRESTHTSVELDILECEFYLWHDSDGLHEDPFTHGSLEQSVSGRWYFHRIPKRSKDTSGSRNETHQSGYRGGSRKGLDLTFSRPLTVPVVTSKHFSAPTASSGTSNSDSQPIPAIRGGILLRSIRNRQTRKVISGPSLLVDHILSLSGATDIPHLVEDVWGADISAFRAFPGTGSVLTIQPKPNTTAKDLEIYTSPRIGLDLAHPGTTLPTTSGPIHPRVSFVSRPYRYFVSPELLTANGRPQTFLGILSSCLNKDTSTASSSQLKSTALKKSLLAQSGMQEKMVVRYLEDYISGTEVGVKGLKQFVGVKGSSSSPSAYLRMMGMLRGVV